LLLAGLYTHLEQKSESLNSIPIPLYLEKDKPRHEKDLTDEGVIALRQNLS
jgi:hypothetical protein